MIKLCKSYISNILLERRDKLVEEVKKMILVQEPKAFDKAPAKKKAVAKKAAVKKK